MACLVVRNEHGSITDVKAPNGESSVLFQSLLKHYSGNAEKALKGYALTQTPSFREWFAGSKMVDEHGEPKIWYHDVSELLGVQAERSELEALQMANEMVNKGVSPELVANLTMSQGAENLRFSETQPEINHELLGVQEEILRQMTDGAVSTISARPVYIHSLISPTGGTVTAPLENVKLVDTSETYATEQSDDLFMPAYRGTTQEAVASGSITKLIQLKEYLENIAEKQMAENAVHLKYAKGDENLIHALESDQARLREYLDGDKRTGTKGLRAEIKELRKVDSRDPVVLQPYITKELDRVKSLIGGNIKDVKEAEKIIDFIIALGDVNNVTSENQAYHHPIFEDSELFDKDGNSLLKPEWKEKYQEWKAAAEGFKGQLLSRNRELAEQIVNENPNVGKMYGGQVSLEDILGGKEGLKDLTWIDAMFFDIGSGLTYRSGMIPQISIVIVNEEFEHEEAWVKSRSHALDKVLPGVVKRLIDMGQGIPGRKAVSYSLFRQQDANGQFKSNLNSKYSFEWEDASKNMFSRFYGLRSGVTSGGRRSKAEVDKSMENVYKYRNNWLKNNSKMMNPGLIPEIAAMAKELGVDEGMFGSEAEQEAHKQELIALVGKDHYNKLVKQQVEKIKSYNAKRRAKVDQFLSQQGKTDEADLDDKAKVYLRIYEAEQDPFMGAVYSDLDGSMKIGRFNVHSEYSGNIHVPLRESNGRDLGYYDQNYAKIEADPVLKEFYDIVHETTSGIWDRLDYDMQKATSESTVFTREKNMLELFLDKDIKVKQAMSIAYRRMIDGMKGVFGVQKQDPVSAIRKDPVTGLADPQINSGELRGHQQRIDKLFRIRGLDFQMAYKALAKKNLNFKLSSVIRLSAADRAQMLQLAATHTGLTPAQLEKSYVETLEDSKGKYEVLRIGKAVHAAVTHDIVREASFDLPRALKHYTNLAGQYAARKRVQPIIEMLKSVYDKALDPKTTNTGDVKTDSRTGEAERRIGRPRAQRQYENWMNRVVLGNFGLREQYGVNKHVMSDQDYKDAAQNTIGNLLRGLISKDKKVSINGKIYTKQDKEMLGTLNAAIEQEEQKLKSMQRSGQSPDMSLADMYRMADAISTTEDNIQSLRDFRGNLGKDFAASAVMDAFLNVVRFAYFNFNVRASINNVIVGQTANMITAAGGQYFPPEYMDQVGFLEMVAADMRKTVSKRLMSQDAAKMSVVMEDYNMLQDASDDLQRSFLASQYSGLRRFSGYYMNKKGEYYNQTPLVAAMMRDQKITGFNGVEGNLFDAMIARYDKKAKKWVKELRPEFRTPENVASWEHGDSKEFARFKAATMGVIVNTHGDYNTRLGAAFKTTAAGQPLMMFKSWLPKYVALFLAKQSKDLVTGTERKGLVRSHTWLTAGLQGAVVATGLINPFAGLIVGGMASVAGAIWGRKTEMNPFMEAIYVTKLLARKMMGVPINAVSRLAGKGNIIKGDRAAELLRMEGKKFDKIDFANYQANIQLLALTASYIALQLMTKAAFWDDDDDEDSLKRRLHNGLMNDFMELFNNATLVLNPVGFADSVTSVAAIRWLKDFAKALGQLKDYITGDDINTTGINQGESKFENTFQKIALPKLLTDYGGFGPSIERQFQPSPFDEYFYGEEKLAEKEVHRLKEKSREQLREVYPNMDDEQFKKLNNRIFGRKNKRETYVQYLNRVKMRTEARRQQAEAQEQD